MVAREDASRMQSGDLVVVRHGNDLITHRLLKLDATGILTKGDQCILVDPIISQDGLLGKVVTIHRQGATIDLSARYWQIANRWLGWLARLEAATFQIGGRWLSFPFRLVFRATVHLVAR